MENLLKKKKAVLLWTGGKDSALAYFLSQDFYDIELLVTFIPKNHQRFYAHPVNIIECQAQAMNIPHACIEIIQPMKDGYIQAMRNFQNQGFEVVITGDIAAIDNQPNWIKQCAENILQCHFPLWDMPRKDILQSVLKHSFKIIIGLTKQSMLDDKFIGKYLNQQTISLLKRQHDLSGIDICGENGEYHTMTLDAPFYSHCIELENPHIKEHEKYAYLDFDAIKMIQKK